MKSVAQVRWVGRDLVFEGGVPGGPDVTIDGSGKLAPSPVTLLLMGLGACMAADVVDIATKMRVAIREVVVDVDAERSDEHPRRVRNASMAFRIAGGTASQTERLQHAIDLSREKYCSVLHSLDPAIGMTISLEHEAD